MFQGEYEYTLDEKNRVVLPANLRKGMHENRLGEGFTVVIGRQAKYLALHPMQEWVKHIDELQNRFSEEDEDAEEYFRDILSSAIEINLDSNYRFIIPEASKNDAEIGREVIFIGMWKHIEIWDKERWAERKRQRAGLQSFPKPSRSDR